MKANSVGDLFNENKLRVDSLLNSGNPLVTLTPDLTHVDGIGLIIVVAGATRVITANGTTDNVVAATHVWTFANGSFGQGDVGATFVIANSGAGNNGSYVIDVVTNDHTVHTVGAPVANETFGATVTATLTDTALQATITFEVSNDYVQTTLPGLNQVPSGGHWADITSEFSPAPAAITAAGNQYIQAYPLVARRGRLTITPTGGASLVSIYYSAKGNR